MGNRRTRGSLDNQGSEQPHRIRSRVTAGGPAPRHRKRRSVGLIDESDSSLLDVLDNLLNKGVVLNADVVLALANVDLVSIRLSALLCAADRILKPPRQ